MSLITILVVLIVVGAVLYCINLLPIDATFKRIAFVIAVVFVVVWIFQQLGLISGIHLR